MSELSKSNIDQVDSIPFDIRKKIVLEYLFTGRSQEEIGQKYIGPLIKNQPRFSYYVSSLLTAYNLYGRNNRLKNNNDRGQAIKRYYKQYDPDLVAAFMDEFPIRGRDLDGCNLYFEDWSSGAGFSEYDTYDSDFLTHNYSSDDYGLSFENKYQDREFFGLRSLSSTNSSSAKGFLRLLIIIIVIIFAIQIIRHLLAIFSLLSTYTIFNY